MAKPLGEMSREELGQLFPIIISRYDPNWHTLYQQEKEKIERTLGLKSIQRINHTGSTAIPNIHAKPTIDILLEISQHTDAEQLIDLFKNMGYGFAPQPNKPIPHMMFMKGYTPQGFKGQAYHIHVRYGGDWDELYFRDYLLLHPEIAEKYGRLKLALKEEYEFDRDGYTDAKTSFIKSITEQARRESKV
jgi:GrpB-like predicted nucleotidyltransferase (UPF0157 family)